jgi:membrane protease YdiL (CAAX protease family)
MFRLWQHFVALWLYVVLPWAAAARMRRLARRPPTAMPLQRFLYPRIVFSQWLMTVALVLVLWKAGTHLRWLGLALPQPVPLLWTAAVVAVAWALWDHGLRHAVREPARRARLLERFTHARAILPVDRSLVGWWIAVSITAGVCEETLFRGYFGFYTYPWMPLWVAALVGSALFGFAHLYQGPRGMLRTGAAGLILWGCYLATGSILPGMLLHAAIDVRSGLAFLAAQEATAREVAAAPPPIPSVSVADAG